MRNTNPKTMPAPRAMGVLWTLRPFGVSISPNLEALGINTLSSMYVKRNDTKVLNKMLISNTQDLFLTTL